MLSYKKIPFLVFVLAALSSCMEQKVLFNFPNDANRNFFKEIPGLGSATYLGKPVTRKANYVQVYKSSFREKYIEKDHLLEFTELNDSTKIPFITYKEVDGYSQDLYLLKYEFTFSGVSMPAAVFFAVKHNRNGDNIGVTPCYFGVINEEDNLIAFYTELSLKKDKDRYYLKPVKKSKKMQGVVFMPADFPSNPKTSTDKFNIEKIVRLDPNKVGGYKPLVFDITQIFHDTNALQFHYETTLHLTQ